MNNFKAMGVNGACLADGHQTRLGVGGGRYWESGLVAIGCVGGSQKEEACR